MITPQTTPKKQTDQRFKILYALGMIFIVAGHCGNGGLSLAYEWFPPYSFHLGLFVFASGYFYNGEEEAHIGRYILKKARKLLLPLYLWNLFYAVLMTILQQNGFRFGNPVSLDDLLLRPLTDGHQFIFNMGGWFIAPLFMLQVYHILFRRLIGRILPNLSEWIYFLWSLVLGIAGVYLASEGFHTGAWLVLVRVLYFVPFYGLGTLYRRKLETLDLLPSLPYFLIIFLIQLAVVTKYQKAPAYTASWCSDFNEGPILPFVVGFLGIAFWFRIARLLTPVLQNSKAIRLIADNTYSIMINQFFGFWLVKMAFWGISGLVKLYPVFSPTHLKTDIWYYYLPNNMANWLLVYFAAGLVVPILMQAASDRIKGLLGKMAKKFRPQKSHATAG